MKFVFALLAALGAGCGAALADPVPLPPPRPALHTATALPRSFVEAVAGLDLDPASISGKPSACDERLDRIAVFDPKPRLIGPGACGGADLIQLEAVLLPEGRVAVEPAPLLRCAMAESLAAWLRDEVGPRLAKLGSPLRSVENYDSYECRSRNRIKNAKISEHAKGDAIDIRAFRLADGRRIEPTDAKVDRRLREDLRDSACHRFTTVLGPGEPYHSGHIHLDILERRRGYRICQWEVFTPAVAGIPLPVPKPASVAFTPSPESGGDGRPINHGSKL